MTEAGLRPGAEIQIDLAALQENYGTFAKLSAPAACGVAVKADAYGLGVDQCAGALRRAGCRIFFVAQTAEALHLRGLLPDATIYILNGLIHGGEVDVARARAIPALNSLEEIDEWAAYCRAQGERLPAAIHVESGINRLGLLAGDVETLAAEPARLEGFSLALVLSHLASADAPADPMNERQRREFDRLKALLPDAPASLANSFGVLLGAPFHYQLTRPGIAIYGAEAGALNERINLKTTVRFLAEILQVRKVRKDQTVGYSHTWRAARDSRIAVLAAGYADGVRRALSSTPDLPDARAWIAGHYAPIVGRISMDMITVDVTDIPEDIAHRGARVELLGDHVTVDETAKRAGTIGYEIYTGLGSRPARIYTGG